MSSENSTEIVLRRKAIRLTIQGKRPCEIVRRLGCSRQWLHKWQRRFEAEGWKGLESLSRAPHCVANSFPERTRLVVLNLRRRCESCKVGLITAGYLQQQIIKRGLLKVVPSPSTINRWLKEAGLIKEKKAKDKEAYFPAINSGNQLVRHLMDWTQRFVTGGEKVFAFHTLDVETRALCQSLFSTKRVESAIGHALLVWQSLGLPDFLQIDNDPAFCGGTRTVRRFGAFVRLCLHFGVEVLFIPPGEPKRNGDVEAINHLWSKSFWQRNHFCSLKEVKRSKGRFLRWYNEDYCPPKLSGKTPFLKRKKARGFRLCERDVQSLPEKLPITEGRIHFIRKVDELGVVSLLGESWFVGKRLQDKYVWATINTAKKNLTIYCRGSSRSKARKVKEYAYEIAEKVVKLEKRYRRRKRRVSISKLL